MSSGYELTVTFHVEGAETRSEAENRIGLYGVPGTDRAGLTSLDSGSGVRVTRTSGMRYTIRDLKEDHQP